MHMYMCMYLHMYMLYMSCVWVGGAAAAPVMPGVCPGYFHIWT